MLPFHLVIGLIAGVGLARSDAKVLTWAAAVAVAVAASIGWGFVVNATRYNDAPAWQTVVMGAILSVVNLAVAIGTGWLFGRSLSRSA